MRKKSHKLQPKETFLFRYPQPSKLAIDVGVCYPSTYRTGMSNLAFHFLYDTLKGRHGLRVERVFLDSSPDTLDSKRPVVSLNVLFFTVSYEEDYFNLVRILSSSGIEPFREKRKLKTIIIVGGPSVTANPFPLFPVADALVLGEGEGVLERIAAALEKEGPGKGFLNAISQISSVLVPMTGKVKGERRAVKNMDIFSKTVIITPDTTFSNTCLIEIGRGCYNWCNFCLARGIYGRFRYASVDWVRELAARLTGDVAVGLVSTAVLSHPHFDEIVSILSGKASRVTVSSIRAEDLDEDKAKLLVESGLRSAALAPESCSERVRFALGKRVRSDVYINAAKLLTAAGIKRLSLYMITGLDLKGTETISEIRSFLREISSATKGARLTIHANVLIPKAATPFQFLPFPIDGGIKNSIGRLSAAAADYQISVKFKSLRSAKRQAILSIGDERAGEAVVLSVLKGFTWKKALQAAGVDEGFIYGNRDMDTRFPWDDISGPATKEELYRRYTKSLDD